MTKSQEGFGNVVCWTVGALVVFMYLFGFLSQLAASGMEHECDKFNEMGFVAKIQGDDWSWEGRSCQILFTDGTSISAAQFNPTQYKSPVVRKNNKRAEEPQP